MSGSGLYPCGVATRIEDPSNAHVSSSEFATLFWYFGAKAHIGVDSKQGVVHSVCTSAASVADMHRLPDLLHGEERKVWGDGAGRWCVPRARRCDPRGCAAGAGYDVAATKFKKSVDEEAQRKNTTKARIRAKVEHSFRILKCIFG